MERWTLVNADDYEGILTMADGIDNANVVVWSSLNYGLC